MEHCIVDGERCSKCCEVLTIRESKNFREWRSYTRRNGYSEDCNDYKMYSMIRKISKRRAKKINPDLVKIIGLGQGYFTCKNFTGSGCGIYENRPNICSKYPYYGRTKSEFLESDEGVRGGLYTNDCTYYIKVN